MHAIASLTWRAPHCSQVLSRARLPRCSLHVSGLQLMPEYVVKSATPFAKALAPALHASDSWHVLQSTLWSTRPMPTRFASTREVRPGTFDWCVLPLAFAGAYNPAATENMHTEARAASPYISGLHRRVGSHQGGWQWLYCGHDKGLRTAVPVYQRYELGGATGLTACT
jgi:hypothetical protein